ncbi:MAG: BatA domain-containing protein [Bacteroidota bacterium]
MNFLNPLFLLGLLAVALPIIIHLINLRRPQKVAFSTLSFFNELRKSTIRRIRIKQYVLLALRALAILFLAIALAQPFLPPTLTGTAGSGDAKSIAILMDNSASMNRVSGSGPLFDQAKSVADRIISNASSDDKFLIQTTNFTSASPAGFIGASDALNYLEKIESINSGHYTLERFRELYQQLQDAPRNQAIVYIISDGQQSQLSDLEDFEPETEEKPVSVQLIELEQAKQQNVVVASASLESQMLAPGSPITLAVELENTGDAAVANQFVSLQVEQEMAGQYETSLQPGETKEFLFELMPDKAGDLTGQIVLEGDEVDFDNNHYFSIRIPESRSILLVDGDGESSAFESYLKPALEAARETNARLDFEEKQPDDVSEDEWSEYDGVVLNRLEELPQYWHSSLREYVQDGGGLLFFPSEKGEIENYNQFFSLFNAGRFANVNGEYGSFNSIGKLGALEEGHPILDHIFSKEDDEQIAIDSPSLFYYYDYELAQNASGMPILKAANNDPLLAEHTFGEGVILTSAIGVDPGWSNFPVNALFAPFYYRAVLYTSSPESGGLQQHQLGNEFMWEGDISESGVTLNINDSDYKPDIRRQANGLQLTYEAREWEPGIVTISTEEKQFKVAVNQDIMESRFGSLEQQQWQQMLTDNFTVSDIISANQLSTEQLDEKLNTAVFGKEIWNWFIWIALLFLIIETLVSRLYKAESIS